jgi:hypothetical protein
MNIAEMSVAYKLQSNDFQVFYDNRKACFIVAKNVCFDCNANWAHTINQCIFCGTRNYFVWICNKCGSLQSLTVSKKPTSCSSCNNQDTFFKSCFNTNCSSNKNKNLNKLISDTERSKLGSFDSNSPFKLSQNFCHECASDRNILKSVEFAVFTVDNESKFLKNSYQKEMNSFDIVIIYSLDSSKFLTITEKGQVISDFADDIDLAIFS